MKIRNECRCCCCYTRYFGARVVHTTESSAKSASIEKYLNESTFYTSLSNTHEIIITAFLRKNKITSEAPLAFDDANSFRSDCLSFLWSVVGGDICIRIYNTGAIALNYFQSRKRNFRYTCASHFVYRFPAVILHRERAETFDDQIPSASDPLFTRDGTAQLYTKSRERLMASRRRQQRSSFRSLSFVRPSIYPEKKRMATYWSGGIEEITCCCCCCWEPFATVY